MTTHRTPRLRSERSSRLPSPAMVVACVALFVALGGTTVAASRLARDSVGAAQIRAGAVRTAELRDGAVTGDKVANRSLTGADIDVARLGKVPSAGNADTVKGHRVGCPAGTRPAVGVCVETSLRAPLGLLDAVAACAQAGRGLPTTSQLLGLRAIGIPIADPELTAETAAGSAGTTPLAQRVLHADGTTIVQEPTSAPRSFRCVAAPVD